ncbi:MAG TPA: HAD family hydrolase [Polyangiales bacterium]
MPADLERLHRLQHWVFDLDGTLTLAVHDFDAIRAELGVPPGKPILEHIASLPREEGRTLEARLLELERALCQETNAADGAEELLASLHARGAKLGVLTRNARELALLTLEHVGLARFFEPEAVLGREQARPKPHAEGFERLALRWRIHPRHCAMLGDFRFDLEVGRAVGALTVHIDPSGTFAWPELTDIAVRSLRELLPPHHA